jgi:hypothetical protein
MEQKIKELIDKLPNGWESIGNKGFTDSELKIVSELYNLINPKWHLNKACSSCISEAIKSIYNWKTHENQQLWENSKKNTTNKANVKSVKK